MSDALSAVGRTLVTICDSIKTLESFSKVLETRETGEENYLHKAALVNRLVLFGFTLTELGMIVSGKKSDTLSLLKKFEMLPRGLQIPVQFEIEKKNISAEAINGMRAWVRILDRGLIGPISDFIRVSAEGIVYSEKRYFEMSPEELKAAKKPVYEIKGEGEDARSEIVDYRPVDLVESGEIINRAQKIVDSSLAIRVVSNLDLSSRAVDSSHSIYGQLVRYLFSIERSDVSPELALQQLQKAAEELDLVNLNRIPHPLHNDAVFSRYQCPILFEPIRDPVKDPTDGKTIYERRAILNWLETNPTSPMTRTPLTKEQLIELPLIKAFIDSRLAQHKAGLESYLSQANPAVDLVKQAAALAENPD